MFTWTRPDGAPTAPTAAPPVAANPAADEPAEPSSEASPSPAPQSDVHLTVGYAGDVLMHLPILDATEGGQGNIAPLARAEQPWIEGADVALCGMEVPLAPDGVPSGFPVFGTLPEVVTGLDELGWDGCATASNHSWDRGLDGVVATADALEAAGMGWSGTNRTRDEAQTPYQIYELSRGGRTVRVAQLSTTFGLNGFVADPDWAVDLNDVDWVAGQARAAREAGADVVVLHSQLGEEYSPVPIESQTEYARAVAATGEVDVFFGAHPHVPQTDELLDGGPGGRGMWASYSAGNFISNQSIEQGTVMAGIGTFVWIDVTVPGQQDAGGARVDGLHWHPFTVDINGGHRILDLAAAHDGAVPEWCTLAPEEIERRWEAVTSTLDMSTYSAEPPVPTGPLPSPLPRG